MSLRRRTWVATGLAALTIGVGPTVAQQAPGAAAQGAQSAAGAEQRRGGPNGGGGGGGRAQTQPLGDGPWDVTTEQAHSCHGSH